MLANRCPLSRGLYESMEFKKLTPNPFLVKVVGVQAVFTCPLF